MKKWTRTQDLDYRHTAETMYEADGFRVWKGKYRVFSSIYSANEWHLERIADRQILYSGNTAKKCREVFEAALKKGVDVNKEVFLNDWVLL